MDRPSFSRALIPCLLALSTTLAATLFPARTPAQLIGIKSVPVATGDQFLIYPSVNLGLGGVSTAMNDPLLDPFVNPAKGARLNQTLIVGAPTFYMISDRNGSGRTLPQAFLTGSERWFGGGAFALQQLVAAEQWTEWRQAPRQTLSEKSARNLYLHGFLGRRLGKSGVSLAGSLSWAELGAVDGVEHLYVRSERIDQDGRSVGARIGILGDWGSGKSFEALLLHNRFDATHDVHYLDWLWRGGDPGSGGWASRIERNLDQTNTSGLHLGFSQPLSMSGCRLGVEATVNRKSHPKIPNYELQNIPRDPGDSWAWNFGAGLARTGDGATYGIDVVFEPIWSDTWADAARDTVGHNGRLIRAGEKTVENAFTFSNFGIRMGIGHNFDRGQFQLGLRLRSIQYDLTQFNHILGSKRDQTEHWMEWTPSWGVNVGVADFDLHYAGRLIVGTGRPGVEPVWRAVMDGPVPASDFLPAPEGPLTLRDAWVMTHRVSVSIPVR